MLTLKFTNNDGYWAVFQASNYQVRTIHPDTNNPVALEVVFNPSEGTDLGDMDDFDYERLDEGGIAFRMQTDELSSCFVVNEQGVTVDRIHV